MQCVAVAHKRAAFYRRLSVTVQSTRAASMFISANHSHLVDSLAAIRAVRGTRGATPHTGRTPLTLQGPGRH